MIKKKNIFILIIAFILVLGIGIIGSMTNMGTKEKSQKKNNSQEDEKHFIKKDLEQLFPNKGDLLFATNLDSATGDSVQQEYDSLGGAISHENNSDKNTMNVLKGEQNQSVLLSNTDDANLDENAQQDDNTYSDRNTANNVENEDVETGIRPVDTAQPNQNVIYDQLFDLNNKVTIKIDISDKEIMKLEQDYKKYMRGDTSKSPIYRRASKMTITINNKAYVINDVGVRLKGNTTRTDLYNGTDVNNRNLVHFKISFKQTFDDTTYYGTDAVDWTGKDAEKKLRKNRTFAGLEGLELKWNVNCDSTYITNTYANMMFKDMGVLAQNTTVAPVTFGNMNYGIYTVYEPVDEKFIQRNLPVTEWGGDLYKCAWADIGSGWSGADYTNRSASSIGVEDEDNYQFYVYDLKTNKKKSTNTELKNMISVLNNNPSLDQFSSVVDLDYWTNFAAASYFAGNPDDLRNNYNNHYVYFLKSSGKAVFIAYDYDRSFGIKLGLAKDMSTVSPYSNYGQTSGQQNNPLFKYTVTRSGSKYGLASYKTQLAKIAASKWFVNDKNFINYYNIVKSHYESYAIPDSRVHINKKENTFSTSELKFSLSNSYNQSVSNYISTIVNTYKNKINDDK